MTVTSCFTVHNDAVHALLFNPGMIMQWNITFSQGAPRFYLVSVKKNRFIAARWKWPGDEATGWNTSSFPDPYSYCFRGFSGLSSSISLNMVQVDSVIHSCHSGTLPTKWYDIHTISFPDLL